MTENSAEKRAARRYQAEHPGMTYPEALAEVRRLERIRKAEAGVPYASLCNPSDNVMTLGDVLRAAATDDEQLLGVSLTVDHLGGSFDVDLGPEIEGPVDVDNVDINVNSLWYDEHEQFDGETMIGEAHVTAEIVYSACVFKSTSYTASDDAGWQIVDNDWNDHYIRVEGTFTGELVYHFVFNPGSDEVDAWELQTLTQVDDGSAVSGSVAV